MLGYQPPPDQAPHPGPGTPLPQQTATVANGTHPTGMHSCYFYFSNSGEDSKLETKLDPGQWLIYIVEFWTRAPRGTNSFNFMQFLGEIWQNRMLAPLLEGWRTHLGEILDPPLERVGIPNVLLRSTNVG